MTLQEYNDHASVLCTHDRCLVCRERLHDPYIPYQRLMLLLNMVDTGPMWPLVSGLSRLLYGNGTSTHEMQMFGEGLQVNGDRFSALQWYTRDGKAKEQ